MMRITPLLDITFTLTDEDNDRSGLTSDDFIIYHLDNEGNIATIPGVDEEGNPIQLDHVATSFSVVPDGSGGYSLKWWAHLIMKRQQASASQSRSMITQRAIPISHQSL